MQVDHLDLQIELIPWNQFFYPIFFIKNKKNAKLEKTFVIFPLNIIKKGLEIINLKPTINNTEN